MIVGRLDVVERGAQPVDGFGLLGGAGEIAFFPGVVVDVIQVVAVEPGVRPERQKVTGREGLADVRIIEALYRSAAARQPVLLPESNAEQRPSKDQVINKPKVKEPELVHTEPPTK